MENPYSAPEYVPEELERLSPEDGEIWPVRVTAVEVLRAVNRRFFSTTLWRVLAGLIAVALTLTVMLAVCAFPLIITTVIVNLGDRLMNNVSFSVIVILSVLFLYVILPAVTLWAVVWLMRYLHAVFRCEENWRNVLWQTARRNGRRVWHLVLYVLYFGVLPMFAWGMVVLAIFLWMEWTPENGVSILVPLNVFVVPLDVWLVVLAPGLWLVAVHDTEIGRAGAASLWMMRINLGPVMLLVIFIAAIVGVANLWMLLMWEIFGTFSTPTGIFAGAGWGVAGAYVLFFYAIFSMMGSGEKLELGMRNEE